MSTALQQQTIPLLHEGLVFWETFTEECRSRIQAINAVAQAHGLSGGELIRADIGNSTIRCSRDAYPATAVEVVLQLESWGPTVNAAITGRESPERRYMISELEIPIARDLDGSVVGIFDEGRSFSPADVARFLLQSFRRSFPKFALPC